MSDSILRLAPETLARIDTLKARIELQARRSLHRSTVLLRILDAGCPSLEMALEASITALSPISTSTSIPSISSISSMTVEAAQAPIAPESAIGETASRASSMPIATEASIPQASGAPETPAHPDLAEEVLEMLTGVSYDASRYKLGKLCPRGHDYEGTGQSLLSRGNSVCGVRPGASDPAATGEAAWGQSRVTLPRLYACGTHSVPIVMYPENECVPHGPPCSTRPSGAGGFPEAYAT